MKEPRPTLLAALARRPPLRGHTERTEHVAVEALGHVLSTSEAARAALSDIVAAGGAPVGPIVRVRTQDTGEKGARPDLAGFDESGLDRVLIGDADAILEPVIDAMVARLEEVAQLLGATSRRRGAKRDGAVARDRRPGEVSAAVAAGMRQDFPRRVGSLRRLVDDATNRGKGKDWADTTRLRATVHASGYGRYLSLGRVARAQVWFGIQFWCWVFLQPPPTLLRLWFTSNSLQRREPTRRALEPLRGKNPSELIDDGAGGLWVPVPLPVDKEYDAVLEEIVERLEAVARLLDGH